MTAPINLSPPQITGLPKEGIPLKADPGTWEGGRGTWTPKATIKANSGCLISFKGNRIYVAHPPSASLKDLIGSSKLTSIAYGAGYWVATTTTRILYSADNGKTWNYALDLTGFTETFPFKVSFANDTFAFTDFQNRRLYVGYPFPSGGIEWREYYLGQSGIDPRSVVHATGTPNKFFVITYDRVYPITVSTNGYTYPEYKVLPGTSGNAWTIVRTGSSYLITGYQDRRVLSSSDGLSYTQRPTTVFPATTYIRNVLYHNGILLARSEVQEGSTNGVLAVSTNEGSSWELADDPGVYQFTAGNGRFVGYNGTAIKISTNGKTWTSMASPFESADAIRLMGYGNGKFIAISAGGVVAFSPDLTDWQLLRDSSYYDVVTGAAGSGPDRPNGYLTGALTTTSKGQVYTLDINKALGTYDPEAGVYTKWEPHLSGLVTVDVDDQLYVLRQGSNYVFPQRIDGPDPIPARARWQDVNLASKAGLKACGYAGKLYVTYKDAPGLMVYDTVADSWRGPILVPYTVLTSQAMSAYDERLFTFGVPKGPVPDPWAGREVLSGSLQDNHWMSMEWLPQAYEAIRVYQAAGKIYLLGISGTEGWIDEYVPPVRLTYQYQWYRGGQPIAGAVAADYVPTSQDVGHPLTVKVTAHQGSTAGEAMSGATAPIVQNVQIQPPQHYSVALLGVELVHRTTNYPEHPGFSLATVAQLLQDIARELKGTSQTGYTGPEGPYHGLTITFWDPSVPDSPVANLPQLPVDANLGAAPLAFDLLTTTEDLATALALRLAHLYMVRAGFSTYWQSLWVTLRETPVTQALQDFAQAFLPGVPERPPAPVTFFLQGLYPVGRYLMANSGIEAVAYDPEEQRFHWEREGIPEAYRIPGVFTLGTPSGGGGPTTEYEFVGESYFPDSRPDRDLSDRTGAQNLLGRSIFRPGRDEPAWQTASRYKYAGDLGWKLIGPASYREGGVLRETFVRDLEVDGRQLAAGRRHLPERGVLAGGFQPGTPNWTPYRQVQYLEIVPSGTTMRRPVGYELGPQDGVGGAGVSNGRHAYLVGNRSAYGSGIGVDPTSSVKTITRVGHAETDPVIRLASELDRPRQNGAAARLSRDLFVLFGGDEAGQGATTAIEHLREEVIQPASVSLEAGTPDACGTHTLPGSAVFTGRRVEEYASDRLWSYSEAGGLITADIRLDRATNRQAAATARTGPCFVGGVDSLQMLVQDIEQLQPTGLAKFRRFQAINPPLRDSCAVMLKDRLYIVGGVALNQGAYNQVCSVTIEDFVLISRVEDVSLTALATGLAEIAGGTLAARGSEW